MALSENPEHELAPPADAYTTFEDPAIYALHWDAWYAGNFGVDDGNYMFRWRDAKIPLYGILRPFRQILLIANSTGGANIFRAEIYYTPVTLNQTEQQALNRQKGGYRRT